MSLGASCELPSNHGTAEKTQKKVRSQGEHPTVLHSEMELWSPSFFSSAIAAFGVMSKDSDEADTNWRTGVSAEGSSKVSGQRTALSVKKIHDSSPDNYPMITLVTG
jgi:hypothetical protein